MKRKWIIVSLWIVFIFALWLSIPENRENSWEDLQKQSAVEIPAWNKWNKPD